MRILSNYYSFYRVRQSNLQGMKKPVVSLPNFGHEDSSISGKTEQISNIYYYPVNIHPKEERVYSSTDAVMLERPGDFKIGFFDDVPCPACGRKMLTRNMFETVKQELDDASPDEYLDVLGKYTDYMRPVELSVFQEIKDISDTTDEKDIRTLIVSLRDTKLPQLQKIQMQKLKQMRKVAKSLPPVERKTLMRKLNKLETYIKKKNSEAPFRRKIMIDRINKLKISNPVKHKKLQNLAHSFPTSSDMNSAWIVKYSGKNKLNEDWSSIDIAKRFLEFSVPNTDHIIARDLELNHDDIPNYMSMHSACNSKKANKSFLQWYHEDKSLRLESLKAYFARADEIIKSGQIDDERYKDYVAKATELIREISQGLVDLTDEF